MADMGRPAVVIDDNQLRAFLQMKPTQEQTAFFFNCSGDTIARYIRDKYDMTFAEFRDQNMVVTRFSLIQQAITQSLAAKPHPAILIFTLKNMAGWTDKVSEKDGENDDEHTIRLSYAKKVGPDAE